MKRAMILLFALSIILISINSCEDAVKSDPVIKVDTTITGGVLWPLKIGNTWNYDVTDYDSTGINIDSSYTDTFLVIGDTTINNEKWFGIHEQGLFRNGSDGVYFGNLKHDILTPSMVFKYPANTGDTYYAFVDTENELFRVTAKLNITVKAGTFFCYKYVTSDTSNYESYVSDNIYYFSPNNGFIKQERYAYKAGTTPLLTRTYELTSLILK